MNAIPTATMAKERPLVVKWSALGPKGGVALGGEGGE
jgi:hypothetical protein